MPNHNDDLLLLLEQHNNNFYAAGEELVDDLLRDGGRGLSRERVIYALSVALTQISRLHRKAVRQHLKLEELAPVSTMNQNMGYKLSARAKKAIQKRTLGLLATWMIGNVELGNMNKAGLLKEEMKENTSANGHRINAEFYSRLAEPMNDTQLVKDHWKDQGAKILHEKIIKEIMRANRSSTGSSTGSKPPAGGPEERLIA